MTKLNATPEDLAKWVLSKVKGAKISHRLPNEDVLSELFKTLFYTSLKTEEGQYIRVTITLIDPKNSDPSPPRRIVAERWQYVRFDNRIPLTVKNLVKLSKAADVWSSSLAVYFDDKNELFIWGMIDQAIHYHSYLNYESESGAEQPGIFQSTITGVGSLIVIFDYELIATLKQETLITNYTDVFNRGEIKELFELLSIEYKHDTKKYLEEEFPKDDFTFWDFYSENIIKETLSRILLRIQNYQHGGAVLITNDFKSDLDIKYSISYDRLTIAIDKVIKLTIENTNHSNEVHSDYLNKKKDELPIGLYLDENVSGFKKDEAKDELKGAVRFVASLSCVDGLVLMNTNLKIIGFGTVIKIAKIPDNIYLSKTAKINESKLGKANPNNYGTRHRSMFSYCWNHIGSIGFVVSQDGDIRAITRIGNRLIMWENIRVQRHIMSRKLKRPVVKRNNGG
jgi:hypothetical protein